MKIAEIALVTALFLTLSDVHAYETERENKEAQVEELERETDQKMHRIEEKTCSDSDTECWKEKVKNRSKEASESVRDKTEETKNKVDE